MTEQEQMNDLIDKVYQWGVDRKIIGNGKLETQWLKLLSEFGEMCDTLAKGGDPIDDIGDQLVVLIMMAGIAKKRGSILAASKEFAPEARGDIPLVSQMCINYIVLRYYGNHVSCGYKPAMSVLAGIAANHNHTLYQCLEHAYNQIKDRKGYPNEQGVFIKE